MDAAPYHSFAADAALRARAFWIMAEDGIRLRAAHWPSDHRLGTVLIFTGRTEYIEKYAPLADDLNEAGYDVLTLDWRGQGLSDRLQANARLSHIHDFADYQRDVVELIVAAGELDLPQPWHLLSHSMGGLIGYAALIDGLPVRSAVFCAPLWGVALGPLAPFIRAMVWAGERLGQGAACVLGSGGDTSFPLRSSFVRNRLTGDGIRWGRLVAEHATWPELTHGGVSYDWLTAALGEMRRQRDLPRPEQPALIIAGTADRVISLGAIRARMKSWLDSEIVMIDGARHEPMIERHAIRRHFLNAAIQHFRSVG